MHGERAAMAIARFVADRADLVLGGRFTDWPLLGMAGIQESALRIDPAAGLFGFAITRREGFLSTAAGRQAVAMAINRPSLLATWRSDWAPAETILPEALDSARPPARPDWAGLNQDIRLALARTRVQSWAADNGAPVVRIHVPPGSGGTLLWARV
ncbi:ABC transporter substrate-binding protein, partial [Brasilonema bromeliae SPC951]|nr:ABC transporter substrate-binding protein [Brasilonema bromeliae SPC951]